MTDDPMRRQMTVTSTDGEPPHELAPHVVRRVAVAMRETGAMLDDPAAAKGCAIVTGVADGRPITVVVGRSSDGHAVAVRLEVMRSAGARAAAIAMPITLAVVLALSWFVAGRDLLLPALLVGLPVALGVGMGVFFRAVKATTPTGADQMAAARIHRTTWPALTSAVEGLGLCASDAPALEICGLDVPLEQASSTESGAEALAIGDGAAWTALMRDAIGSVVRSS
jgi:hypothetical protein